MSTPRRIQAAQRSWGGRIKKRKRKDEGTEREGVNAVRLYVLVNGTGFASNLKSPGESLKKWRENRRGRTERKNETEDTIELPSNPITPDAREQVRN